MKTIVLIAILFVCACGTPTPSNNDPDSGTTPTPDATVDNDSTNVVTPTNVGNACPDIGPRFIDAVRELPRSCTRDTECRVVSRAQVCDCDLAVSASADLTTYDAVRAELDTAQCSNPFGCAVEQCPYRRLSEPGELFARCTEMQECELVQILPCSEFQARSGGGIVAAGGCSDNSQCTTRADLNPCGCGESITTNFPFLTVQVVTEMMEINEDRCGLTCAACDPPGTPVCGSDMICRSQ